MDAFFLSLDEVLEIHEQQIERYGGSSGLRDVAALESAVATPQATFGGEFLHSSVPAMAAAYLFHLCQTTRSWTVTSGLVQTRRSHSCSSTTGSQHSTRRNWWHWLYPSPQAGC